MPQTRRPVSCGAALREGCWPRSQSKSDASSDVSSCEQTLLAVLARVQAALGALDVMKVDADRARAELQQAVQVIQMLGPWTPSAIASVTNADTSPLTLQASTDIRADTNRWLLHTFTEHDLEAADTNTKLHAVRVHAKSRSRGKSFQEELEEVHKVISNPTVAGVLERSARFDFDALALVDNLEVGDRLNSVFGAYISQRSNSLVKSMQEKKWISDHVAFTQAFLAFLSKLDGLYLSGPNVYHGAAHAVDVTSTTEWMIRSDFIRDKITTLDHFMSLAAAAVHDVGHPGKNNLFHSKTMSPLAIRYNDKSILENMHVALAFQTMQQDSECNWFEMLARDAPGQNNDLHHQANLQQYVRKGIISMVLATDMAKHHRQLQELGDYVQAQHALKDMPPDEGQVGPNEKQRALDTKLQLLNMVLHAADISNPCKPRPIMLGWTKRVCLEYWAQGDEEKALGLPVSPMCDRAAGMLTIPKGQLTFVNFVVSPYLKPFAELADEVNEAMEELAKNAEFWKARDAEQATFSQIFGEDTPNPAKTMSAEHGM